MITKKKNCIYSGNWSLYIDKTPLQANVVSSAVISRVPESPTESRLNLTTIRIMTQTKERKFSNHRRQELRIVPYKERKYLKCSS